MSAVRRAAPPAARLAACAAAWIAAAGAAMAGGAEAGGAPAAAPLDIRFIGNEAFAISDGRVTLLTDFPYRSGYSGYMTYDPASVRPAGRVVTLITHRHPDHFEPEAFLGTSWEILGPREVTDRLPRRRVIPMRPAVELDGVVIRPIPTPHRDTEHYSYLVEWGGRRLYFVGDTEDPEALLAARGLDDAFVTPWLLDTVRRSGRTIDARRIVIYHHTAGQEIADCGGCVVPRQGERLAAAAASAARAAPAAAAASAAPASGAAAAQATVDDLGWLAGSWGGTHEGVRTEEHWSSPGGGLLLGMHREIREDRPTAFFEFLRIQAQDGVLAYLAQPAGRPATAFPVREIGEERVVFENPDHDFPQRIVYWRTSPDELRARIEGTVDGKPVSREWIWKRTSPGAEPAGAGRADNGAEAGSGAGPGRDTVVLLHGLGRTPRSMRRLETALRARGYRVENVGYPSRRADIATLSEHLGAALERCCAAVPGRIHFVTHSLGGIVVRHYLAGRRVDNLGRVVMLGPPNGGSELVDLLKRVPGLRRHLGPSREQLGTDAASPPAGLGPVGFELGVIAGSRSFNPLFSSLLPGPDDGMVAVARTRVEGMRDFLVVPRTHTFMMRSREVARQTVAFLENGVFARGRAGRGP
jgi:hypothetical protein